MPTYCYKAKLGPDRTVEGEIEAESRPGAMIRLERMGYSLLSLEEQSGRRHTAGRKTGGRVRPREITVFTRQLAGLLRAGVPILRALTTIQQQTDNPAFQSVVMAIAGSVRDGRTLSESLAVTPALFPDLYVNMVRAGESAGMMDEILMRLAEARENDDELRSRVASAVAYPAFVIGVGALSVFVILTFFLPRIVHIFDGMNQALPWPTRTVLAVSGVCSHYWPVLVILAGLIALALKRHWGSEAGRMALDSAVLGLPVVGAFARDTDIVRFARTLSLLIKAGISVDRALALAANTLTNRKLRADMAAAAEETVRQLSLIHI